MACRIAVEVIGHEPWEVERGWSIIRGVEQSIDRVGEPGETGVTLQLLSAELEEGRTTLAAALGKVDPQWERFLRIA